MTTSTCPGLFVTGTDTEVGKTRVASAVAKSLRSANRRVGVYKPVASGCSLVAGQLHADDAQQLWEAAGRPLTMKDVCPQQFAAPLAPHVAARKEGKQLDSGLLRSGLDVWTDSDVVVVEGVGGLMSPLGDDYVADLVRDFGFPLLVVVPNVLGAINQALQTLITAAAFCDGLPIAGIVLNHPTAEADESAASNRRELEERCVPPIVAELKFGADRFDVEVDWFALAAASPGG